MRGAILTLIVVVTAACASNAAPHADAGAQVDAKPIFADANAARCGHPGTFIRCAGTGLNQTVISCDDTGYEQTTPCECAACTTAASGCTTCQPSAVVCLPDGLHTCAADGSALGAVTQTCAHGCATLANPCDPGACAP